MIDIRWDITSTIIKHFSNLFFTIWELILLCCLCFWYTILIFCTTWYCFFRLYTITIGIICRYTLRLTIFYIRKILIIETLFQSFIKIFTPFSSKHRSKEIILIKFMPFITPKIIKDIIWSIGCNLSKWHRIIIMTTSIIFYMVKSLVYLIKFSTRLLGLVVVFWMGLKS
jgi:hypothetical protein